MRYALVAELWGLRRESARTAQAIEKLQRRLEKLTCHGAMVHLPKTTHRIRKALEESLSDKRAFHDVLKGLIANKQADLVAVETQLRVDYRLAASGDTPDQSLSGDGRSAHEPLGQADRDSDYEYDLFVSHAAEDNADFVRPLAGALRQLGLRIWYDEAELSIGDSLRESIDRGLTRSRYGLVVLSKHFLAKRWTAYELDSLAALEMERGKVILPIWHGISRKDLLSVSPKLADKFALRTESATMEDIAIDVAIAVLQTTG